MGLCLPSPILAAETITGNVIIGMPLSSLSLSYQTLSSQSAHLYIPKFPSVPKNYSHSLTFQQESIISWQRFSTKRYDKDCG